MSKRDMPFAGTCIISRSLRPSYRPSPRPSSLSLCFCLLEFRVGLLCCGGYCVSKGVFHAIMRNSTVLKAVSTAAYKHCRLHRGFKPYTYIWISLFASCITVGFIVSTPTSSLVCCSTRSFFSSFYLSLLPPPLPLSRAWKTNRRRFCSIMNRLGRNKNPVG